MVWQKSDFIVIPIIIESLSKNITVLKNLLIMTNNTNNKNKIPTGLIKFKSTFLCKNENYFILFYLLYFKVYKE